MKSIMNLIMLIGLILFFMVSAHAASAVKLFDTNGVPQGVAIVDGKLIITSDSVPEPTAFQVDIIQRDTVDLSESEETVTIASDAAYVILQKITGTVTMYVNASTNLPEVFEITADDYSSIGLSISEYDTSLIFTGTGTVEVEQRRRPAKIVN